MRSRIKGLFNVEYLTVLIFFIIFSTYFTFRLMEQSPSYLREVKKEIFRSENYRLSEILVNDPGEPVDWDNIVRTGGDINNIKRIGLSVNSKNETNILSEGKINSLRTLCARADGYDIVKKRIGAEHSFSILIIDLIGTLDPVNCGPGTTGEVIASVKRLVAFDSGNYGEVIVQIW